MTILSSSPAAVSAPRIQMNARISAAVAAGSISSTDQTALSTALDGIDTALQTGRSGGTTSMKDRIDSLIDAQVTSGTLTDDQAAELKDLFAQGAPAADGTSRDMAMAGPRSPGGPPPPPSDEDDDDSSTATTSIDTLAATLDKMTQLLEKLRASVESSSGTYAAGTTTGTASSGLVFSGVA